MKVRRYFANSMREALEAVRRDQGSEALILSNRTVDGGIELIVAAGEIDQSMVERLTPKPRASATDGLSRGNPEPAASALWTHPDTVTQMQRELGAIKGLIEQQLSSFVWHDYSGRSSLQARLLQDLAKLGVVPHLARQLVGRAGGAEDHDEAWQCVMAALSARLTFAADPLQHGGTAAFCGATGVGKTTLISKLAARHALRHGVDSVAVISTDEQRLGAHHQLLTFGRLLGIRVEIARDRAALGTRLTELAGTPLVLIDLPGWAPRDARFGVSAEDLNATGQTIDLYLVAAATTEYLALNRTLQALADVRLAGCCISKLDEAAGLGTALSMLVESGLPLAYVSEGQQVPDDNLELTLPQFIQRAERLGAQIQMPVPAGAQALSA